MKEKKKVLLTQIIEITREIEKLKEERKNLIEKMKNMQNGITTGKEFSEVPDYSMKDEEVRIKRKIEELEQLLADAEAVVEYDEDSVSIGTRFTATVSYEEDEIETDEYVLSSTKEGTTITLKRKENDPIYITPESPFGAAVMGKKINECFYYKLNDEMVVGFIEYITPKEEMEKGNQKTK